MLLLPVTAIQAATLVGFAELPADTFRPGPTSGQHIEAVNGRKPPFVDQQPVQGFSALLKNHDGTYYALSDNGFGRRSNSADYILSIYLIKPDLRTADNNASGSIGIENVIQLSDPDHYMPYAIVRGKDRLLTGADLDPESFQRTADGSFWIGEEFNPSILHFSADGKLMAEPYLLDGLASVENPQNKPATLPRSRGFEGMALSADGDILYPMLEGALLPTGIQNEDQGLGIYSFDIESRQFRNTSTDKADFRYRLDEGATAIGDLTLYSATRGLVIERDSAQGGKARIKKIYQVDFEQLDADGFLKKTLWVDLLHIDDPDDLNRDGKSLFTFPYWTIEGLIVLNSTTLAVVNDNNYPYGPAREAGGPAPDNTEFILLTVAPLW